MHGYVYVHAESMDEAVDKVQNGDGDMPLPDDADYVEGSFEVDHDGIVEEIE